MNADTKGATSRSGSAPTPVTVSELAHRVRTGGTSAAELIETSLRAIESSDDELHAFLDVLYDSARDQARDVDRRIEAGEDPGPLAGVPVALKDNICTRGFKTTCASRILESWVPPYDATVVERLRAAGAVIAGKTNLDEFAMGSSTENSAFGPTRNPHCASRVPGGSSGGSAAAVAAGFVPLALGSDTGGSIRQPAALCGVVGMKPTYGTVSRYGLVAFASSLDQIGPLARSVADAAALFDVIGGHDPRDSTSLDRPSPSYTSAITGAAPAPVKGLRVGLVRELLDGVDPAVAKRVNEAAEVLSGTGAIVEECSIPEVHYALPAYYLLAPAEASSNLARYDGVRYGLRVDAESAEAMNGATRQAGFGAEVKRRIMLGTYALSAGYYDAYYGQAQKVRTLIIDAFDRAYENLDVLLGATTPTTAFELGSKVDDPLAMYMSDTCTVASNLSGHPAISVPFGTDDLGLPVGVQVLAPALGEAAMFQAAAAIEAGAPALQRSGDLRSPMSAHPNGNADADGKWEVVIGLEVHCELKTKTKLFCGCRNAFGDDPNTNVCPVCLGLPGSLPVLNSRAVELAMAIGVALNCEIRASTFHRKNYFYPDMPKDYQISQYDEPINVNGWLELADARRVGIVRAHIEEDTGKTSHIGGGGRIHDAEHLLVDYNRAGVPLVEIVSAPDIRSATQARQYVEELRAILVAVGASDGKMEEGSLRVDANVSVRALGTHELGTRCEVKNLNSLRSLVRAIEYEAERQAGLLDSGEHVLQQTRHWDESAQNTVPLRSKEEAFDYRYFPEPDLVAVAPDPSWQHDVAASLPPMPAERRARLAEMLGVREPAAAQADQIATVVTLGLDQLVTEAAGSGVDPALALARTANEAAAHSERVLELDRASYVALLRMEQEGKLSATQAKAVLAGMVETGGNPSDIARRKGFEALGSDALSTVVSEVLSEHPDEWERYRGGDDKLAGFFTGKVMQKTAGKANGKEVAAELRRLRS